MADKKKMSVADMLAAARKADGGGDDGQEEAATPVEEATPTGAETAPAESPPDAPAAKPGPVAKPGSKDRPAVSDILAMARSGQAAASEPAAKKPKPKPKGPAKPAAKPAAKKAASAESRDTASILAAARKENKPGPISKAEAAAKTKSDPTPKAKPTIVVPPMPTKPDYAKPAAKAGKKKAPAADGDENRRGFMSLGFWNVGLVTALWTLASVKFFFPNVRREPPSKFKVGSSDGFPPGQVETKYKAQFGVWVVNTEYNGQQQLFALKSVCTHLGCTPSWLEAEQKFKCPCHGSGFYKDGVNFEGPAPRPLERCAIQIASDGQVEIDKSRTFQEEMGQWEDPASFVPA